MNQNLMVLKGLSETIQKHLNILEVKLSFYFPSTALDCYDLVSELYSSEAEVDTTLTLQKQEELTELIQDRGLGLRFSDLPLESFWLKISNEFSNLAYRAISILPPFSTAIFVRRAFQS